MEESAQRWLFALSAPMAALNGASYTAAEYYEGEDQSDLERWWGISNRAQLLDMLGMADTGHATEVSEAYWQFQRCLPSQWQALLDGLSPRERVRHEFAARTFPDCGPGGTRAWDLGRMSFLLRAGVKNDLVSRDESLYLHYRLALRARHYYNRWDTYLAGYLFGKALWNVSDSSDETFAANLERQGSEHWNRCILLNLRHGAHELLAGLPWDLQLPEPEHPNTLEEDCWS
ncbi:DUF1266 domain-containing protein [Pseudomonas sichuanensis]|uniref:DUF1266 domain-containing protein n=1 Tax=Pseudomonas sichuanensis TaxID=2213015 RepID=UPI00216010D7|nr:DUF1266 domain-containing protein [Pseudomonas sichuanensis]UVK84387.1 DUF1266 domain-containing protein [Pseudomonas sichuanensis]